MQKLLKECFDHTSHLRPSFSEIYECLRQNWEAENAGPLKVEPELSFTERGADAYCKRTLAEEGNGNTPGDSAHNIPASQLVNEVFRNALREAKDQRSSTRTPAATAMTKRETVRLRTYDNKTIEMPYEVAMRSCTLCWQLQLQEQELGQSSMSAAKESRIIVLNDPSCTLLMISKVIMYVQTLLDTEKGLKENSELRKVENILTEVGEDDIFALLMVANYLDLPELTYLACKGLNPHVENDATSSEKDATFSCPQHTFTTGRDMSTRSEVNSIAGEQKAASTLKSVADQPPNRAGSKTQKDKTMKGTGILERVPELPARRHRFDREELQRENTGPRPTRSRSSPAKPHQLSDGIIYTTGQVLSEEDMKRMIPGQQSPAKQHFLPGVGMLESITDWGKSSWIDLVEPRFAHAAVPPSPSHGVKRHRPDQDQPIPPKRMARLDSNSFGRIHQVPTESAGDASVHCTPNVQQAVKEAVKQVPKRSDSLQVAHPTNNKRKAPAPEKDAMPVAVKDSGESMSILEFRRMIHPDGDRYAGTCKGDLMHGIGVCHYANGDKYYGQWRAGMRHGIGRMEWNDGHMYEGSWRQDIVSLTHPHMLSHMHKPVNTAC